MYSSRVVAAVLFAAMVALAAPEAEAQLLGPFCVDVSGPLATTLISWAAQASSDGRFWNVAARDVHGNVYTGSSWVDTSDGTVHFNVLAGPRFDGTGQPRAGIAVTGSFLLASGTGTGRCSGINVLDPMPPPTTPACPTAGTAVTLAPAPCP